jgi:parallel beta-helix repeat protein
MEETIWLSPTEYVTGDPSLEISYPFVSHPSTIITCTAPGDFKWVSMGLRLPQNVSIEEIIICYQVSNKQSFISQVRLSEMGAPDQALVIHDDGTDLQSTMSTSYSSKVGGKIPTPGTAVTLALRLNFKNTTDQIMLGAVGVKIQSLTELCVNSIADLRALDAGVVSCLTVLGYHAPGDGGGGNFHWDGLATEADNAGTIIIPASNPAVGRWKRLFDGPLSVKWFGAKGNGAADDTAAIQATIAWTAGRAESGAVYVPPGTYKITGRLTFQDDASPPKPANGLTILGDGYASFLALDHQLGDGAAIGFYGKGASNITIRDLRIGALPSGAGFNRGIVFTGGSNITILDNDISGAIYGVGPDHKSFGYPSGIFLDGGVTDVRVLDNYLHDNGVNDGNSWHIVVYTSGGAHRVQIQGNRCITDPDATFKANVGIGVFNSTHVEISGNYVEGIVGTDSDHDGYGIMLYGKTAGISHHHVVQGNTVKRTGGTGIYVQGSPYTTVTGNIIEDVAKTQYAGTLAVGGIGFNQGPGSIIGNVIRNVGVGNTQDVLPFGIVIQTCVKEDCGITDDVARGITVSGNTIESSMNYGIALEAAPLATADNSTIIGNTLVNTHGGITRKGDAPISGIAIIGNSIIRTIKPLPEDSAIGIFLEATSNSAICNNVIANSAGQGIVLYTDSNRNVLSGNIVRDSGRRQANAYPGIQVVGANNLIAGNESYNSSAGGDGQKWGIQESGENNDIVYNNVNNNLDASHVGIFSTGKNTARSENRLAEDKSQGTCTLAGGQCHVTTMEVQAADMILLSRLAANGTLGHLSVQNIIAGSFDIVSSSDSDSSEVFWEIVH